MKTSQEETPKPITKRTMWLDHLSSPLPSTLPSQLVALTCQDSKATCLNNPGMQQMMEDLENSLNLRIGVIRRIKRMDVSQQFQQEIILLHWLKNSRMTRTGSKSATKTAKMAKQKYQGKWISFDSHQKSSQINIFRYLNIVMTAIQWDHSIPNHKYK